MEARFQLIASYWSCSYKNYDQGGWTESLLAKFTTKEKADDYLAKHLWRLKGKWGDGVSFSIEERDDVPVDPE